MKINTKQAGEILGITAGAVRGLIESGRLHDIATKKEGKKKHYSMLENKEVREFKKVYKKRQHHSNGAPIPVVMKTKDVIKLVNDPIRSNVGNGLMTRLGNIETKLDLLLKMWS